MSVLWWLRNGLSWPGVLLAAFLGGTLGLGGYTFWYGEGLSYFSNDPRACANCHIMRDHLDSWQKSSHHAHATCNDCHVPHDLIGKYLSKAYNGFWHSKGFTFQDFHEPIRIKPINSSFLQANCIECHAGIVHSITHLGSTGDSGISCVHCHITVGHGPSR
ncbi:MAG: cytochrome c nitrite reductase small subunit [Gemmataceae bacterium]